MTLFLIYRFYDLLLSKIKIIPERWEVKSNRKQETKMIH